jgi:hypothetical protein
MPLSSTHRSGRSRAEVPGRGRSVFWLDQARALSLRRPSQLLSSQVSTALASQRGQRVCQITDDPPAWWREARRLPKSDDQVVCPAKCNRNRDGLLDPWTPFPTRGSPSVPTAGRPVQWPVFGLADVLTDRSVSRPEVVAESGTAQDVREAGHGDGLGIAAPRSAPSSKAPSAVAAFDGQPGCGFAESELGESRSTSTVQACTLSSHR